MTVVPYFLLQKGADIGHLAQEGAPLGCLKRVWSLIGAVYWTRMDQSRGVLVCHSGKMSFYNFLQICTFRELNVTYRKVTLVPSFVMRNGGDIGHSA